MQKQINIEEMECDASSITKCLQMNQGNQEQFYSRVISLFNFYLLGQNWTPVLSWKTVDLRRSSNTSQLKFRPIFLYLFYKWEFFRILYAYVIFPVSVWSDGEKNLQDVKKSSSWDFVFVKKKTRKMVQRLLVWTKDKKRTKIKLNTHLNKNNFGKKPTCRKLLDKYNVYKQNEIYDWMLEIHLNICTMYILLCYRQI